MSRGHKNIRINNSPIFSYEFYDALSQEFRPACDPEGRTHTLAGLAIATIEKGETIGRDKYSYQPSWAEGFTIDVVGARLNKNGPKKVLWVGMHGPHRDLSMTHDREQKNIVVTSSGVRGIAPEIELPALIQSDNYHLQTRAMISAMAEIFFMAVPQR